MACGIYKRRWTCGPRVPAEQRCASLSVTCKAFIGFIYLAASGRRMSFLLLRRVDIAPEDADAGSKRTGVTGTI